MFEKKFYNLYFYRERGKLAGLLDVFELTTKYGLRTDIRLDETGNEWKLTVGGTAYFERTVKVCWWILDKCISLAEKLNALST